jgi:hypothetical protein
MQLVQVFGSEHFLQFGEQDKEQAPLMSMYISSHLLHFAEEVQILHPVLQE